MSVSGHTWSAIQAAIRGGIVGQTFTGDYLTFDAHDADDATDPTVGDIETVRGAVRVNFTGSGTIGSVVKTSSDGPQEMWASNYLVTLTYRVSGVEGSVVYADLLDVPTWLVDKIKAALQTFSATNYNISRMQVSPPVRKGDLVETSVALVINHFYAGL